eukprot:GHVU01131953.1.p2 GENE.GHVU01131953.1~~GHVU01131953.1.p2  ORF type:complete len:188 (+),score=25.00 GHVU01131953.1:70-633(+)
MNHDLRKPGRNSGWEKLISCGTSMNYKCFPNEKDPMPAAFDKAATAVNEFGEKLQQRLIKAGSSLKQATSNMGGALSHGVRSCDDRKRLNRHFLASEEICVSGEPLAVSHECSRKPLSHVGEVWGTFNYYFSLQMEMDEGGHAGKLVAKATRRHEDGASSSSQLPINCKWKRKVGDRLVHVPDVRGG